jgi:hypothetical protein
LASRDHRVLATFFCDCVEAVVKSRLEHAPADTRRAQRGSADIASSGFGLAFHRLNSFRINACMIMVRGWLQWGT